MMRLLAVLRVLLLLVLIALGCCLMCVIIQCSHTMAEEAAIKREQLRIIEEQIAATKRMTELYKHGRSELGEYQARVSELAKSTLPADPHDQFLHRQMMRGCASCHALQKD